MGGVRGGRVPTEPALVFNSTPLIYLAKAGLADKLSLLPFRLTTTRMVYDEVVVRGTERRVEEAIALRRLFNSGIIEVVEQVDNEIVVDLRNSGIHHGEATVMSLARKLNAVAVMDDKRARHVAKALGVRLSGTPHVMMQLVRQGLLTKQEARHALDKIIEEGWYCSAKSYSEILKAIDGI